MSIQLELVELYDEAINAGYEQSAKTLLSAMKHIETLQEELDRYRNGYQGSCYCCETVGEKNVELEARVKELIAEIENLRVQCDGLMISVNKAYDNPQHKADVADAIEEMLKIIPNEYDGDVLTVDYDDIESWIAKLREGCKDGGN